MQSGQHNRPRAQQLARLIIARREDWPTSGWLSSSPTGNAAPLLTTLRRTEDARNIEALLAEVSAEGCYDAGDIEALADAAISRQSGPPSRQRIIARNAPQQNNACAELLRMAARFLARWPPARVVLASCSNPPATLVAALPGDPAAAIPMAGWQRPLPVTPALVVDLLTALCHLGVRSLGEQAVDHLLNWPDPFALDTILVAATCLLTEQGWPASDWAPTGRLRAHCLDHLARRIAEPLVPPVDFARESRVDCSCATVGSLGVSLTCCAPLGSRSQHIEATSSIRSSRPMRCQPRPNAAAARMRWLHQNQASFERRRYNGRRTCKTGALAPGIRNETGDPADSAGVGSSQSLL
jgi:hypothetical protein